MFGPRITHVFRSRWHALWWSACILMTAYCSIPSTEDAPNTAAPPAHAPKHINPWAKDAK